MTEGDAALVGQPAPRTLRTQQYAALLLDPEFQPGDRPRSLFPEQKRPAMGVLFKEVSFQWKNPDFLLKNPDLLLKNLDFLLKNAEFTIKPEGDRVEFHVFLIIWPLFYHFFTNNRRILGGFC